jgi:hypothetical protein
VTTPPPIPCPACHAKDWQPYPLEGVFGCRRCRFAVDQQEPLEATLRRASRWRVFSSTDAGLPPRWFAEAGIDATTAGTKDILPEFDAALREKQQAAVEAMENLTERELKLARAALVQGGRRSPSEQEVRLCAQMARMKAGGIPPEAREAPEGEPWVVRYYGDGAVSYHSFAAPMADPRDAHLKTEAVARAVANRGGCLAWAMNMRQEAVPLAQAIREYDTQSGRHAPGAATVSKLPRLLLVGAVIFVLYKACVA